MDFPAKFRRFSFEIFRKVLFISAMVLYAVLAIWCCGVIHFQPLVRSPWLTTPLLLLYFGAVLASLFFHRKFPTGVWIGAGTTLLIAVLWFSFMKPSGNKDWQVSCLRIPEVEFHPGNRTVTVKNIRDFRYRTPTDFDVRYLTQTYPLDGIREVDYALVYWDGMTLIGHVILSFCFDDGRHLAVSAEARLEKGEQGVRLLAGIYRQYELIYIVGTEEDIFQLRTNYRHEDVYLYPTTTTRKQAALLLEDLLKRAADLKERPRFYNTVLFNCTSSLYPSIRRVKPSFKASLELLFNGVSDQLTYRSGWLCPGRPGESFGEYKKRHFVNPYVDKLDNPPDYSARIRSGF